jgi:carboxymethylenebutenolidase
MTGEHMNDAMRAQTSTIPAVDGAAIEAYYAVPERGEPHGSIVVIHHAPGYDEATKEIARRFAAEGFAALCPNLYSREAPGLEPRAAAAQVRAAGGVPDAQVTGDVAAAAEYLRARPGGNGKVGVIGYCTGGRQAVLAACELDLDAVVDCYGAYVTRSTPEGDSLPRAAITHLLRKLTCPLLGLFGAEDPAPPPAEVAELESALKEHGKDYEIQVYENAGHAFFSTDSPKYRTAAALAGWQRIVSWCARHLSAAPGTP